MAAPTLTPTRCPTPISAIERLSPTVEPPAPSRNATDSSLLSTFRAASSEKPAAATEPATMARRPFLLPSAPSSDSAPTLSASAAATPSGYGRSEPVTRARRSGTEYMTPSVPPMTQTATVVQYGKPCHHPIMIRPGSTKMIEDRVPAADAMVCTNVVLEDRVVPEVAQQRHRDHRGRDRGGEGQPDLQAEIHVRGGEHQGDQAAQDDTPDGELTQRGGAGRGRPGHVTPRLAVWLTRPGDYVTSRRQKVMLELRNAVQNGAAGRARHGRRGRCSTIAAFPHNPCTSWSK